MLETIFLLVTTWGYHVLRDIQKMAAKETRPEKENTVLEVSYFTINFYLLNGLFQPFNSPLNILF